MTNRQSAAQESTHFRVLRLLEGSPDLTQREIAEHVGISLGGVNYCLRALVDKGLIKIQNLQNSRNKLGYVYLLTPSGIAQKGAMTAQFLRRKLLEYEALKAEIKNLEAELGGQDDLRHSTSAKANNEK